MGSNFTGPLNETHDLHWHPHNEFHGPGSEVEPTLFFTGHLFRFDSSGGVPTSR
jgi:hypothetical protein